MPLIWGHPEKQNLYQLSGLRVEAGALKENLCRHKEGVKTCSVKPGEKSLCLLTSIRTGCWSPPRKCAPLRTSGRKRPLSGTQHNFHDTKRETLKRARPQVVTSRDNRLTDTSVGRKTETLSEHDFGERKTVALARPGHPERTDCVYSEGGVTKKGVSETSLANISKLRRRKNKTVNLKSLFCLK